MTTWIKWWKNKTFNILLVITLLILLITFLFAYLLEWGWVVSVIVALVGGFIIRKIIIKALDNYDNNLK